MNTGRCLQQTLGGICRRRVSDVATGRQRFIKHNLPEAELAARKLDNLIDLESVHKEWKSAGYFPKAPEHIVKYGTASMVSTCRHFKIFDHVFGGLVFKPCPLHVTYQDKCLNFGTFLTPTDAAHAPQVAWEGAPDKLYTLLLVGPDSHPTQHKSCLLHWCVTNITSCHITSGKTVAPYLPPVPYKGTGFHRLVFVLLEQSTEIELQLEDQPLAGRTLPDSLTGLMTEYNLHPIGVSFYQSIWDASVGRTLAVGLDCDEKQFSVDRMKSIHEHYAEEEFMYNEWKMRTEFM